MNDCFAFTYICRKKTTLIATTSRKKLPPAIVYLHDHIGRIFMIIASGCGGDGGGGGCGRVSAPALLYVGYPITIAFGVPSYHQVIHFIFLTLMFAINLHIYPTVKLKDACENKVERARSKSILTRLHEWARVE